MSVLIDESNVLPASAEGTSVAGNEGALNKGALELLSSLGRAVATGAEAGEDVGEVSAGPVKLRVRWWHQRVSKLDTNAPKRNRHGVGKPTHSMLAVYRERWYQ